MSLITSLRERPLAADSLLAATAAAFALLESTQPGRGYSHPAVMIPAALLVTLPLALRRRAPAAVLAFILVVELVAALAVTTPASAALFVALLIGIYTVFVRCSTTTRLVWLPFILVGAAVVMFRDPDTHTLVEAVPTFGIIAAVMMVAQVVRRSREQALRLRRLADELAASRAEAEQLAVTTERLRIAREMHDVLAHSVSVMVLQVGAARMALHDTAPQVRELLAGVENLGRGALEELSDILGLLRDPTDPADPAGSADPADLAPPPGDLGRLAATMRAAGLPLTVRGAEHLDCLPQSLALTVFRLVQEALTNTLKHAAGAAATVDISMEAGAVVVEIDDAGEVGHSPAVPGGGHGLIGLRERVNALGGTVDYRPRAGGGWQVRAVLPLPPTLTPTAEASLSASAADT
jgi:signal transduction histidine kinase